MVNKENYLNPTEEQEQLVLAEWLDKLGLCWMHCPNEGNRNRKRNPKTGKWYSNTGKKLKALGLKKGFPDVIIFDRPPECDAPGVAIELKRREGGRVTAEQIIWMEELKNRGWVVALCRGAGDAIDFLINLGYGKKVS